MIFKVVNYNLLNEHHALSLSSDVGLNFAFVHAALQPLAPAELLLLGDSQASHNDEVPSAHPQGRTPTLPDQFSPALLDRLYSWS